MTELIGLAAPEIHPSHEWLTRAILYHDRVSTICSPNDARAHRLKAQLGDRYLPTNFVDFLSRQSSPLARELDWPHLLGSISEYLSAEEKAINAAEARWARAAQTGTDYCPDADDLMFVRQRILSCRPTKTSDALDFIWEGKGGAFLEKSGLYKMENPMLTCELAHDVAFVSDGHVFVGPTRVIANILQQLASLHCAECNHWDADTERSRWVLSVSPAGQALLGDICESHAPASEDESEADLATIITLLPVPRFPAGASNAQEIDYLLDFHSNHEEQFSVLRDHMLKLAAGVQDNNDIRATVTEAKRDIENYAKYGIKHCVSTVLGSFRDDIKSLGMDSSATAVVSATTGIAISGVSPFDIANAASIPTIEGLALATGTMTIRATYRVARNHRHYRKIARGPWAYAFSAFRDLSNLQFAN